MNELREKMEVAEAKGVQLAAEREMLLQENAGMSRENQLLKNENQSLRKEVADLTAVLQASPPSSAGTIPVIPLPPPQSSSFYKFDSKVLDNVRSYGAADNLISSCFKKSGVNNQFYFALSGNGFAIATPFEQIDKDGKKISDEPGTREGFSDFFRYLFSGQHLNDLFFSKTGYFRCIIIIVSPDLRSLGGRAINYERLDSWIRSSYISLPPEISEQTLPANTQMVALLYEFEQNDNLEHKVQIMDASNCITRLATHQLINALSNEN